MPSSAHHRDRGAAPRFLLYSHDGLGLGHTRRNLAIASALVDLCPKASVLIASGTDETHRLGLAPHVEVLKLPGLRKTDTNEYQSRRLPVARDEIRDLRASLLEASVRAFRPSVVLLDKHPFGARGEFRAGLQLAKEQGGRVALGLRDILDAPETVRREWGEHQLPERIAAFHDRVLIYGERAVFDPVAEYALPPSLTRRTVFCGYVVNHDPAADRQSSWPEWPSRTRRERPLVLATTGGGEDGAALLQQFVAAATAAPWQGVAIAGPLTPEGDLDRLQIQAAAGNISLHPFVPRLPGWYHAIDALVCMGGYNTLAEAMALGVPAVCVPRARPRSEQLLRARAFERLGLLQVIHPDDLDPQSLQQNIQQALSVARADLRRSVATSLNFDGAHSAARELLSLAGEEEFAATGIAQAPIES